MNAHTFATVVALLVVLAFSSSARAECAWVLWTTSFKTQGSTVVSELTSPTAGYSTRDDCESTVDLRGKREAERRKTDPTVQHYFTCLPDTVDPRGPKGGR